MNKLLKTFTTTFVIALVLLGVQTPAAKAHILKTNNGVVAVLHVPPDDKPRAGEVTQLELLLSKNVGGFDIAKYNISLKVLENNKVLQTVAVKAESLGDTQTGTTAVTFPKVGVYQIVVNGKPKVSTEPAFTTNYILRVATAVPSKNTGTKLILVDMVVIAAVGLVILWRYNTKKSVTKTAKINK